MPDVFPFEMDGVIVLSDHRIAFGGNVWTAAGDVWESVIEGARCILPPAHGLAWEGQSYVPEPSYVLEQVARLRTGFPLKRRSWHRLPARELQPAGSVWSDPVWYLGD